ncbi:MAG: hypothetical protein EOM20_02770 [Spartobacteria bacterium]|nr:hypothetical protein [Spartobacteria bacterium]
MWLGTDGVQADAWTNAAGHAMEATPMELDGARVTFLLPSGEERQMPLHSFLPGEQRRLRKYLGMLEIPDPLRSAFRLAESQMQTAQALYAEDRIDGRELAMRRDEVIESFLRTCEALSYARQSEDVRKLLAHWGAL